MGDSSQIKAAKTTPVLSKFCIQGKNDFDPYAVADSISIGTR